jgi:hypothetical protein
MSPAITYARLRSPIVSGWRRAIGREALGFWMAPILLQEQEFERLGSTRTQQLDVRVVAATRRDLKRMVDDGSSEATCIIACTFSRCLFRPCESVAKTFLFWCTILWMNMLDA